jgi:amino acid transporter
MRLNNRNKAPVYNFVNTLLLMTLLGGIAAFLLEEYRFNVLGDESILLIILPVVILGIYYLTGRQIFEYDSDGEAIHFKNRNVIPFLSRPLNDEFPKYKLIKYEVVSIVFIKRLYVTISSKNSGSTMLKYEISFLTRKEVNDLKLSLNKVVKANNEKKY